MSNWNKTTTIGPVNRLGVKYQAIEEHRFTHEDWISRPCWFWPKLAKHDEIAEVRDPWGATFYDYVFCEDISRFIQSSRARQFLAGVDSQFVKRFLIDPTKKGNATYKKSLQRISYQPQARLAM